MDAQTATTIQAIAAVAAVAVATLAAIVAWQARKVAEQSVAVAEKSVAAAERSAETAQRQLAMAAVPFIVAPRPAAEWRSGYLHIDATAANAAPALSVVATVMGALDRFVELPETAVSSGPFSHLAPGATQRLRVPIQSLRSGNDWAYPYLVILVDYYGPHGAYIRQWYDWDRHAKWRLRRLNIDPRDGGRPIEIEIRA